MPDGRTHDIMTLSLSPVIGIASYHFSGDLLKSLTMTGAFLFGGLMFSPDLDLKSKVFRRWGFLRFIWLPYQKICHHRSFWSHSFLFGYLFRMVYLTFFIFLLGLLVFFSLGISQGNYNLFYAGNPILQWVLHNYQLLVFFLVGCWAGADLHIAADFFWRKK